MSGLALVVSRAAGEVAGSVLPEGVTIGTGALLPRGADPFIGSERPLLLGATRWAMVSPGGVLVAGSPAGVAAVFGFDLPARPVPIPVEDRKPGDPPQPKWAELVKDAARDAITSFSVAVAGAVAALAGLPPECAATQLSMNDTDAQVRGEVGPLPDAVVLPLSVGSYDVRVVFVIPGIFVARMDVSVPESEVEQVEGEVVVHPIHRPASLPGAISGPLGAALAQVPIDLSIEIGHVRVPLARVLRLRDGEVLELRERAESPVALVASGAPVAIGDLAVSDTGTIVFNVLSIPGRASLASAVPVAMPSEPVALPAEPVSEPVVVVKDPSGPAGDATAP